MHVSIHSGRARYDSEELLDLSRQVRRAGGEMEDVRRSLRSITELDECRHRIRQQEEAAAVLAARLVSLSSALSEIARAYDSAEVRNAGNLKGGARWYQPVSGGQIYHSSGSTRRKIEQILYE